MEILAGASHCHSFWEARQGGVRVLETAFDLAPAEFSPASRGCLLRPPPSCHTWPAGSSQQALCVWSASCWDWTRMCPCPGLGLHRSNKLGLLLGLRFVSGELSQ